ncbi:MAG: diadenylate cyclase CdaA [Candidatus Dormiibacterota bacterium]
MLVLGGLNLGETLRVMFQTVGWQDALDIVIITYLVYRLLVLIRGTQAMQILVGLLLIGALGALAFILNLPVLKFIYSNGGQVILIGVIILFQPELRRALDQMGSLGRLRRGLLAPDTAQLRREVDEVVRAAVRLGEAATGALIVIQGDIGLEEIVTTGVRLDALLSSEALITVFTYKSPLHDGAAVVHQGRLVAAGCVLPLAEQDLRTRGTGTRHLAAVGLTRVTDAGVVVVSEETGRVSWAVGGQLETGLDGEQLTNRLGAFLGLPLYERHRRSIRLRPRGSRREEPTVVGRR